MLHINKYSYELHRSYCVNIFKNKEVYHLYIMNMYIYKNLGLPHKSRFFCMQNNLNTALHYQ